MNPGAGVTRAPGEGIRAGGGADTGVGRKEALLTGGTRMDVAERPVFARAPFLPFGFGTGSDTENSKGADD